MAIEHIDLRFDRVIEALLWKVFHRTVHVELLYIGHDLALFSIIDKMEVTEHLIVEKVDEDQCVSDEAACHTRIGKVRITHGMIIKIYSLINQELIPLYLLRCPSFLTKCAESKLAVIVIADCITSAVIVLL